MVVFCKIGSNLIFTFAKIHQLNHMNFINTVAQVIIILMNPTTFKYCTPYNLKKVTNCKMEKKMSKPHINYNLA